MRIASKTSRPDQADRSIDAYVAKRDFTKTTEPRPQPSPGQGAHFVVQKHKAHRAGLHYDFRLQHNGVLLSWAVPKGPSLDPSHKRMAVHVEDHPIDYANFQGEIEEGYGAGSVELWDHGTWAPHADTDQGLAKGHLQFDLNGSRLHGEFSLVRMPRRGRSKQEAWLLIKSPDADARTDADADKIEAETPFSPKPRDTAPIPLAVQSPLPASQKPELCVTAETPPPGGDWLSEVKFDGYRLIVRLDHGEVRLFTREGHDWTAKMGRLAQAFTRLRAETAMLDGELVVLRDNGVSDFGGLQDALATHRDRDLLFYAFDLLHLNGWDLRPCRLEDRKTLLHTLSDWTGSLRYSDHHEGDPNELLGLAAAQGLEGIVMKRRDAPYRATRSSAWVKVKNLGRAEFVIIGWTPPARSRVGLGALQIGYYDDQKRLHYAGGVGTGFSDDTLRSLRTKLDTLALGKTPDLISEGEKPPRTIRWVHPELVAEISYTDWSNDGRLRHAVFLGLRSDKKASTVKRDRPIRAKAIAAPEEKAPAPSSKIVVAHAPKHATVDIAGIHISHADREIWPGITKRDLAEYWRTMSEIALPGIAARPLAILRCPEGIDGEQFFQKHRGGFMPEPIREGTADKQPYLAIDDEAGLIAMAQMSAIELHCWGATEDDPEHPDRLVFDLDPGEGVKWPEIVKAAHDMRARLQGIGLESFCRTSGGKGLHVVVPLSPDADWNKAKPFCRAFAEQVSLEEPTRFLAHTKIADRKGRILIDWLRNGIGATAIASFSPRARPGATVATPLSWRELTDRLDPKSFDITTIPKRIAKQKTDPWAEFSTTKQVLPDLAPKPAKPANPEPTKAPATSRAQRNEPEPHLMELRPTWRGHLRLALVSCPVALYPATHDRSNLHFNLINPKTGHRVRMITRDAETEEELSRSDLVKGYEFRKDHYLLLEDEDFEAARIESSSVMSIEKFVPTASIDPVYFDSSYYLGPDGDAGTDVYLVLHAAFSKAGMIGLSRVVMSQRERVVALMVHGKGFVAHTLHEERDINSADAALGELGSAKPDPEMVKLAQQLIERQIGQYDPADWEDRYETRLREVIDAKLKGEGIEMEPEEEDRSNVIDLMAALKQSLGGGNAKPGKADAKTKAKPEKPAKAARRKRSNINDTAEVRVNKTEAALVSGLAVAAAAILGSRNGPTPARPVTAAWYARLRKPSFTPPGPVFIGAWSILDVLLAYSGARVLQNRPSTARSVALGLWGATVGGFQWVMFGRKRLGAAAGVTAGMVATSSGFVAAASQIDRKAAIAAAPLALWTAFACLLQEEDGDIRKVPRMASHTTLRRIGFFLVPAALIAALVLLWNWDWFLPFVTSRASAAIGRPVTAEHLHVKLGRITTVVLDGIEIPNPEGFQAEAPFARIAHLGVDVDAENYIRHRELRIPNITVEQPAILAAAHEDGVNNYGFHLQPSQPADPNVQPAPSQQIGKLTIRDGTAHVIIPKFKTDATATIATQDAGQGDVSGTVSNAGQDSQIVVEVKGTYSAQPITGKLIGGALLSLRDTSKPYPIDLRLANGPTQVSLVGTVQDPMAFAGADLKLDLRGPDMALLFPLTGIPLPKTPPYRLGGQLDYADRKIRFRDFAGILGNSDIAGTIAVDPGPQRQDVTADLHSKSVDLEDLGGFIGSEPGRTTDPNMTPQQRAQVAKAEASSQLIPNTPINLPKLRTADIHLKYKGDKIKGRNVPFDRIEVAMDIVDGRITLHPMALGVGTGAIIAQIDLTPEAKEQVHAKADVQLKQLDVGRMLSATHAVEGAGRLGGQATIDTTGNSLAAMLAAGNGKLDLYMSGGNLSALLVDLSGLQFGNALLSALGIPDRAQLECMIGQFALQRGVLQTRTMLIDTSESLISGRGDIDIGRERLNYEIKTETKHFSIGSLPAPIGISGTFKSPSIGPDAATLGIRGGAAAGLGVLFPPLALLPTIQLGVGDDNRCRKTLTRK
eukprot:gene1392-1413_t